MLYRLLQHVHIPAVRMVVRYATAAAQVAVLPSPFCRKRYDIVVVSPRNYFLYTPLLPAVAVGTLEELSVIEPVRKILGKKVWCDHAPKPAVVAGAAASRC